MKQKLQQNRNGNKRMKESNLGKEIKNVQKDTALKYGKIRKLEKL